MKFQTFEQHLDVEVSFCVSLSSLISEKQMSTKQSCHKLKKTNENIHHQFHLSHEVFDISFVSAEFKSNRSIIPFSKTYFPITIFSKFAFNNNFIDVNLRAMDCSWSSKRGFNVRMDFYTNVID
jgi:hypothetical protein